MIFDGNDEITSPRRSQHSWRSCPGTKKPITIDEDREIIQYNQSMTWAVTKPAR